MGSETQHESGMSRRDLLAMVGMAAGSAAMYQAMTSLGLAGESTYRGSPNLTGAPKGTSVLILGAGLAGLTAAYELRKAGYKVSIFTTSPMVRPEDSREALIFSRMLMVWASTSP